MKKAITVAFTAAMICSMFFAMYAGPVHAAAGSVVQNIYQATTDPTFDGKWTTTTEWDDAAQSLIKNTNGVMTGIFRDKYTLVGTFGGADFDVVDNYLIEFFTDGTNDTGDYVQLCYDTTQAQGSSLLSTDYMVQIFGNGTIKYYAGAGANWASAPSSFIPPQWAQGLGTSKVWSSQHRIIEIGFHKYANGGGIDCNIMIAVYDAGNSAAGVQTWPQGASVTNPNTWGDNDPSDNLTTIPEGFGIGAIVLLSAAVVMVGFYGLRKRSKTVLIP